MSGTAAAVQAKNLTPVFEHAVDPVQPSVIFKLHGELARPEIDPSWLDEATLRNKVVEERQGACSTNHITMMIGIPASRLTRKEVCVVALALVRVIGKVPVPVGVVVAHARTPARTFIGPASIKVAIPATRIIVVGQRPACSTSMKFDIPTVDYRDGRQAVPNAIA